MFISLTAKLREIGTAQQMPNIQTPDEGTEEEKVTPEVDQTEETVEPSSVTPPDEEQPENPAPEQPSPEPSPSVDYKQKFVDSQREGILQHERIKQKEAQIESLTKTDTPTDEGMRKLYSDWDTFNDVTKQAYIRIEAQNMRQSRIEAQQSQILARQELDDKLNDFLESPPDEFNKLAGKESEFRRFAKRRNNIGLPLETLAKAFLFDAEEEAPPVPTREALPAGSGGPRGDLKPKKMSPEEARALRETNFEAWRQAVKGGRIDNELD